MQNTRECRMKSVALTWGFCALAAPALAATLAERIGHYVSENTRRVAAAHDGAGLMNIATIMDDKSLSTNRLRKKWRYWASQIWRIIRVA